MPESSNNVASVSSESWNMREVFRSMLAAKAGYAAFLAPLEVARAMKVLHPELGIGKAVKDFTKQNGFRGLLLTGYAPTALGQLSRAVAVPVYTNSGAYFKSLMPDSFKEANPNAAHYAAEGLKLLSTVAAETIIGTATDIVKTRAIDRSVSSLYSSASQSAESSLIDWASYRKTLTPKAMQTFVLWGLFDSSNKAARKLRGKYHGGEPNQQLDIVPMAAFSGATVAAGASFFDAALTHATSIKGKEMSTGQIIKAAINSLKTAGPAIFGVRFFMATTGAAMYMLAEDAAKGKNAEEMSL